MAATFTATKREIFFNIIGIFLVGFGFVEQGELELQPWSKPLFTIAASTGHTLSLRDKVAKPAATRDSTC
jgi:hypothetical protein